VQCLALVTAEGIVLRDEDMADISGVFDVLNAEQLPAVHTFKVWARIMYGPSEAGKHQLELRVIRPDGVMARVPETVDFPKLPPGRRHGPKNWHTTVENAQLAIAGDYEVQLSIDGKEVQKGAYFYVRHRPKAQSLLPWKRQRRVKL